jgi:uncharacterized protein
MEFIGRTTELASLRDWDKSRSKLTVVYGRRRVGKTRLIEEAFGREKVIRFEGIEGQTARESMMNFQSQMAKQFNSPELLEVPVHQWSAMLSILSRKIGADPAILVFDEFQWIAGKHGNLVGYLKYAWDNTFSKNNRVHCILCGSVSSFMVKKVIRSKALYGRIDHELIVQPLMLTEIIGKIGAQRSINELVEMYMVVGGIPQYFQLFDWKISVWLNIQKLCFTSNGFLVNEFERIFASHFGATGHYRTIIKALVRLKSATREQLQMQCHLQTGGRISEYLENLELAGFVQKYANIDKPEGVRNVRYRLSDFYLLFYFTFIAPNIGKIRDASQKNDLQGYMPDKRKYPWLGHAFERVCQHHHHRIAECLGFSAVAYHAGSWTSNKNDGNSAQIDLLYVRADRVITICEIKYTQEKIDSEVISDMDRKIAAFPNKKRYTIEKTLITSAGATDSLVNSGYFTRILRAEDIFRA